MKEYINGVTLLTYVLKKSRTSIHYHMADKNGRMYMCNCMPMMRINGKIKFCFQLYKSEKFNKRKYLNR